MKIFSKIYNDTLTVYGIYSSPKGPIFCVSPKKYDGIMVMDADSVEVIDPTMNMDFIYYRFPGGGFGFFYRIFIEGKILDDLYELDPVAYEKFVTHLGHEP